MARSAAAAAAAAAALLLGLVATTAAAAAVVDPEVTALLQAKGRADVFLLVPRVETGDYVAEALRWHARRSDPSITRAERRETVHRLRSMIARASQNYVIDWLEQHHVRYESFWITNTVFVREADADVIAALAQRSDVLRIRANRIAATLPPLHKAIGKAHKPVYSAAAQRMVEWNIAHIGADQAWQRTTGESVTVANIDSGVRYTHEALETSFRGYRNGSEAVIDYNWFNPGELADDPWWCDPSWPLPEDCTTENPIDNTGHGSHTMGTIAGVNGIGVAPGAKWIAAKGCKDGNCLDYGLLSSAQWVMCPTKVDGTSPNCTLGADIVSNSWGGPSGDSFYMDWTTAWEEAGMFAVFSHGNSGPRCGTAGSPGEFESVIAVTAVDSEDSLASFSSRGPGTNATGFSVNKPDLSAPGVDIRSATSTFNSQNDANYAVNSGTSMAAPHVSGVAALALSINPSLTVTQLRELVKTAVDQNDVPPDNGRGGIGQDECGGIRYDVFPNYHYGTGRINAVKAVEAALALRKA